MIKVKVNYAVVYNLPAEEILLTTGSLGELKEQLTQKLNTNPFNLAVRGQIADETLLLKDGDEVFVFPLLSGG